MKRKLLCVFILSMMLINYAFAQNRTITGRVTGADDNLPIPSVTIKALGTTIAVQTNGDGLYTVSIPSTVKSLQYSYVGSTTVEEIIGTRTVINVSLKSSNDLDEVIVTGYGSGKGVSSIVGSVATVSAKTVENKPSANVFDAMQGKVAGLQVFTSSGEPSSSSSLRLHGVGSLGASNTPLYLLDGIAIDAGTVVSLNPNDIETVSVLKDASSTSIYGARAANGVVYITSKKGKIGTSNITVQSQYSISNIANFDFYENVFNTKELTDFWVDTKFRTRAQVDALLTQYPNDYNWVDFYYKKDRPLHQTDLTVSGGAGNTSYYISGTYFDQEGIMYRSGFDRYTLRANVNTKINDYLQFGLNLSGGTDNRSTNPYGGTSTNGGLSLLLQPFYSPYDANGNEYYDVQIPGLAQYNPRYLADNITSVGNNLQFNPNAYIQINPFKGLTFRSNGGMDGYIYRSTSVTSPKFLGALNNGSLGEGYTRNINKTWTNTLEYKFNINSHNITALAGQEYVDNTSQAFSASTVGLADARLLLLGNGTPTNRSISSSKSEYAYKSLFGRIEYNLNNIYYLDASVRQDRSSRFGVDKQDAVFWSVGGMWRLKQESFLKDVKWVDDLTLRVSTGTSGNSSIGNYEHLATVGTNLYAGLSGFGLSASGNPLLGWESQQKTSVGVKTSFFNKVRFDLEFYKRVTSNQLISVPYSVTTGYSAVRSNIGSMENMGIDITLNGDILNIPSKKAYITPYLNVNFNQNKITELFQGKEYWNIANTGVTWVVGKPVSYFSPIWKGVNPENGNPEWYLPNPATEDRIHKVTDPNKVTNTFSESALQQNTGIQRFPPINGGFGFSSGFMGLTLDADFSFSKGKYMINNDRYFYENPNQFAGYNQSRTVLDYWKTPGQVATFPRYGVQFTQFDTRLTEDASFIRLKSLQLAYNLPLSILKSTKIVKGAKIFFIGRNLLTFTDYTGPDPEFDTNVTVGGNPNTKQVGLGLQVKF